MKTCFLFLICLLLSTGVAYSQVQFQKSGPQEIKVAPSITVLFPNGGETWVTGNQYTIRWQSRSVSGNVKIMLKWGTDQAGWYTVTNSAPNSGSYNYTVPATGIRQEGNQFKIHVMALGGLARDESDRSFAIKKIRKISKPEGKPKADVAQTPHPGTLKGSGVVEHPPKQQTGIKDRVDLPQRIQPPQRLQPDVLRPLPPVGTGESQEYPEGDYGYSGGGYGDSDSGYGDSGWGYGYEGGDYGYSDWGYGYSGGDYGYSQGDYEYPSYYEEYPSYGVQEQRRDIFDELGLEIGKSPEDLYLQTKGAYETEFKVGKEGPAAAGGMSRQPGEEEPYAGGAVAALRGGRPELLITDIKMRNPNKKELIINSQLDPRDWVFEVKVVNTSQTPVSNVMVLVAVGDKRLESIIGGTIDYSGGASTLVYMRPSQEILSRKSLEVNAIVDPYDQYRENNEDNNLFTKTFKPKGD